MLITHAHSHNSRLDPYLFPSIKMKAAASKLPCDLVQPPEAFLELPGRCNSDREMHSIPRPAPSRNRR